VETLSANYRQDAARVKGPAFPRKPSPLADLLTRRSWCTFAGWPNEVATDTSWRVKTPFSAVSTRSAEGGAGNDARDGLDQYATSYLWQRVLQLCWLRWGRYLHSRRNREGFGRHVGDKGDDDIPRLPAGKWSTSLINTTRAEGPASAI